MSIRFLKTLPSALAFLLTFGRSAQAHDDAQLLGHHWEVPAYIGEVHFQVVLMLLTAGACLIGSRAIQKWSERRIKR